VSGPDIFISYAREERAAARHFSECFAREGFSVWWDAVLRSGQTFDEVIEKELRAAKAVIVLWSPRSVASRWVRAEATLADRANKLVPVIIEACNLPIIFELTHAANLADWTGDTSDIRWQTLVSDLRRLVDGSKEAAPAPSAVTEPAKPKPVSAVSAPSLSTGRGEANGKASASGPDELMRALERSGKNGAPQAVEPTQPEDEATQFFKRSDGFREQEGDRIHCLLRLDGEEQETRFVISPAGLRVGRTPPADIIVPGAGVSRAHCLVEMAAGKVRITDLNSTNGTYVDNKRIERSAILPVGSVLRIGTVSFEHEVRMRAEMEQEIDPLGFDPDAIRREARLARH